MRQAILQASTKLAEKQRRSVCSELLKTLGLECDEADELALSTGTPTEAKMLGEGGLDEDSDTELDELVAEVVAQFSGTVETGRVGGVEEEEENWWDEAATRSPV